jgi:hypothetical protein
MVGDQTPSTEVVALLNKLQAHRNTGQDEQATKVEAQLASLGYDPDGNPKKTSAAEQRKAATTADEAPQGRSSRPRQTTDKSEGAHA